MSYVLSFPRTREEFMSSLIHRTVGKTMKDRKSPLLFRLHLAFRLTTAVTIATFTTPRAPTPSFPSAICKQFSPKEGET